METKRDTFSGKLGFVFAAAGAFHKLDKRFGFVGALGCVVPFIITPYYCVIGGWISLIS